MSDAEMGKYGLTGNSGLTGWGHVSASYDCNGMVFVETDDYWKRMPKEEAEKQGLKIITCSYCDKPAVSLDHHYPYMADQNLCAEHYEAIVKKRDRAYRVNSRKNRQRV